MNVLVLNCGSSSLKYQLLKTGENPELLVKGIVERIGLSGGRIIHKPVGKAKFKLAENVQDHKRGINLILEALVHPVHGVISGIEEIGAVGHRVVHGGDIFKDSTLITQEVKEQIAECCELAPLHNPANLEGINAIERLLPGVPQVAVFDTAFHQTLPPLAYMYGIPYYLYRNLRVRKYGFHGSSHRYASHRACEVLGWDIRNTKIVSCHLGNGASVCAIDGGKSIEISMGFTPNEGLLMGTRTGNLDLGALLFIADKENLTIQETQNLINKESGLAGVSGISSDMRDLEEAAAKGHERAQLALDMFAYRVKRFIGSYSASLNGVDLIIFTGGIGENDFESRAKIIKGFDYLGVDFDFEKNNQTMSCDAVLTKEGSRVKVMTIVANEELLIAMDTMKIVKEMEP